MNNSLPAMKSLLRSCLASIVLLLSGCVTYASLEAASRVKADTHLLPVVRAIEQYRKNTGAPPDTLEQLQANRKEPLKLEELNKEGAQEWKIYYKRGAASYEVGYAGSFCDLTYVNGTYESWSYNPFR